VTAALDEDRPLAGLVEFAQRLRRAGLPLGSDQVVNYCRAVTWAGPTDLGDLYWAGRACLVTSGDQIPLYDAVFDAVFRGVQRLATEQASAGEATGDSIPGIDGSDEAGNEGDSPGAALRASSEEALRDKDFAKLSPAERRDLEVAIAKLRLTPPLRRSHRTRPVRRGDHLDLRRTVRRAMRTHGEIISRSWRGARTRPRRLVLLLDVSGSMSDYARMLVFFAHALGRAHARVEIFCFGTRISRVTGPLRHRDPDAALAAVTVEVVDWDGGTRIGASIDEFMRRWGRAGLARDSLLVICSDGLERDEPAALAGHMERLARLAHRIVWVNPLKGDVQYQPLARGMAAALPHIDHFLAGHSLASLEELSDVLRDIS
jgi:uncharacterized protein